MKFLDESCGAPYVKTQWGKMAALYDPKFWTYATNSVGRLKSDGVLLYVMLDKTYRMMPLVRNTKTRFTDFVLQNADAKKCTFVVNGNLYGLDLSGGFAASPLGGPDDPSDTQIQGQIIKDGNIIAGSREPGYFWFGQVSAPATDGWPWIYQAGAGDPPAAKQTMAAIGGAGPLVIRAFEYGPENTYKPGVPPSAPLTGQPPPAAVPFLTHRSSKAFQSANAYPAQSGKTFLAYSTPRRMLMVAAQQEGNSSGITMAALADGLAKQGF